MIKLTVTIRTAPIPAVPYWSLIKQFAAAKGLKFFTWNHMQRAREIYEATVKYLN